MRQPSENWLINHENFLSPVRGRRMSKSPVRLDCGFQVPIKQATSLQSSILMLSKQSISSVFHCARLLVPFFCRVMRLYLLQMLQWTECNSISHENWLGKYFRNQFQSHEACRGYRRDIVGRVRNDNKASWRCLFTKIEKMWFHAHQSCLLYWFDTLTGVESKCTFEGRVYLSEVNQRKTLLSSHSLMPWRKLDHVISWSTYRFAQKQVLCFHSLHVFGDGLIMPIPTSMLSPYCPDDSQRQSNTAASTVFGCKARRQFGRQHLGMVSSMKHSQSSFHRSTAAVRRRRPRRDIETHNELHVQGRMGRLSRCRQPSFESYSWHRYVQTGTHKSCSGFLKA